MVKYIKQLISKWACHHKWKEKTVNWHTILVCEKCGKIVKHI